jgi:xanthine dehydrogenase YagT iron-sulfur-binding subunit
MQNPGDFRFSRRDLLIVGAASLTAPTVAVTTAPFVAKAEVTLKPSVPGAPVMSKVSFNVNGKARDLEVDTRTTLLVPCASICISPAPRRAAITVNAAPAP